MHPGAEASSRHQKEQHPSVTSWGEEAASQALRFDGAELNGMVSIYGAFKGELLEKPTFLLEHKNAP